MGRHRPRCLIRVVSGHVRKCTASAPTPARSHVSRPERHQRAGRKQTTCQSRASAAGWRDVCRSDQQEPCKPKPQSLPPYSCPKLTTYSCLEFVCEGRSIHRAPRLRRSRSNRSQSGRPPRLVCTPNRASSKVASFRPPQVQRSAGLASSWKALRRKRSQTTAARSDSITFQSVTRSSAFPLSASALGASPFVCHPMASRKPR